ncbi:MAG: dTDP-4-dehydrorhamnose 3,5-epimerase [Propionibacteriales bacterium]|nr:dTDP-4-dehydrorhamnose 3,5-epimerase [Propionibacteriales bacterium]
MDIRELKVPDAFCFTPSQHRDDRGVFLEWFTRSSFGSVIGHPLDLVQANCSVSRRGTLRGIHYADVPPGQAKYVTCVSGAGIDVVVDLRVGSPSFGEWDSVLLDDADRRAVYLAEGLGHAFLALSDQATLFYLCSEGYNPGREHGVHPLDPTIAVEWPAEITPLLSPKDADAPSLTEAEQAGRLPTYDVCRKLYQRRRAGKHDLT